MTVMAPEREALPLAAAQSSLPLIEAEAVGKKYCRNLKRALWYGVRDVTDAITLRRSSASGLRPDEFWAVDGVTFTMNRGDSLGLLGENGSGKSTLIKLITGQRKLTTGRIATTGRIVALTELGLGFNAVLTGRENVYVNASVFGVSRAEVDDIIDDIIQFAGIPDFIDSAVQTYSTGMRARLSFSIAAHLEPDILIVDEVLAVGDLAFRRKCVSHVAGYLKRGGSMLLVAHDPYLIGSICNRAIVLERGRKVFDGSATEGVAFHFDQGGPKQGQGAPILAPAAERPSDDPLPMMTNPRESDAGLPPLSEDQPIILDDMQILPVGGAELTTGGRARIVLHYRSNIAMNVAWGFDICTPDLLITITANADGVNGPPCRTNVGNGQFVCDLPVLQLRPGNYALRGGIADAATFASISNKGRDGTAPTLFTVASTPEQSTVLDNYYRLLNTLIDIPVEFPA